MTGHRHFIVLLFFLMGFIGFMPFLEALIELTNARVVDMVVNGVFAAMLVGAVYAISGEDYRSRTVALWLAPVAVAMSAIRCLHQTSTTVVANNLVAALFLTAVIAHIVIHLFRCRRVNADLICASLCAYLLMGICWALIYLVVEIVVPGSFTAGFEESRVGMQLLIEGRRTAVALYYSFVTLTTLGYGDITPLSDTARTLSTLEALGGQVYLAVLVARLVGLHIAATQPPPEDS